jgi:hypothetical protein
MGDDQDVLPLLETPAGAGGGDPAGTSPANEPTSQPSSANAPGDAGSAGGSPEKTVPLERFQEVNRQIQKYRELGLDALADEWERDPSKRMEFLANYATRGNAPAAPPPPPQQQIDPQQAQQQLNDLYQSNPMQAQALVTQAVVKQAIDELKKEFAPIKAISKRSAIDSFKNWVRSNKPREFKAAEPYFDRIVNQYNFEGMSDQQIQGQLNQAFVAAFGAAQLVRYDEAEKSGKIRPAGTPPSMGTSGGGDMSGTGSINSEQEAEARAMYKLAGWSQKDIDEEINARFRSG